MTRPGCGSWSGTRSASARARRSVCWITIRSARWSFVAYWVTIFFLIVVLVPHIGSMRFGARRWIDLGPFQFQPSEFAKLAFILASAHFLSRPPDELRLPLIFWKGIGLLMLPFALILKEPDLGSALVLLPTGLVMMFVAGTPKSYLLKLVGGWVCWPRCFWWTWSSCRRVGGKFTWSRISATVCWFILDGITRPLLRRTPPRRSCNASGNSNWTTNTMSARR